MKTCTQHPDKNRYNTQRDADTTILLIGKSDLRSYYCETCKGWHLTSSNFRD